MAGENLHNPSSKDTVAMTNFSFSTTFAPFPKPTISIARPNHATIAYREALKKFTGDC